MRHIRKWLALLCAVVCLLPFLTGALAASRIITVDAATTTVERSGAYDTLEEVAVYLSLYGTLPGNYLTKQQAYDAGWDSRSGNLWEVAPGSSIGGDRFGNYEGSLPDARGRTWRECDIGYTGRYRNGQRLLYSSDGLLFYTDDHYNTFRQIEIQHLQTEAVLPAATDKTSGNGAGK